MGNIVDIVSQHKTELLFLLAIAVSAYNSYQQSHRASNLENMMKSVLSGKKEIPKEVN